MRGNGVHLTDEEVRRLVEVLQASARLMSSTESDDRVIDIAKATLVGAAEDWAAMLRRELAAG